MGTPVGKSGDLFVYKDKNGVRTATPVVGLLSSAHTANGSPVLSGAETVRLADGRTVVLGADLSSQITTNGNQVKDLHSQVGIVNSDLTSKIRIVP